MQTIIINSQKGGSGRTMKWPPPFVADRTAYAASMTDGRTAQELQPKAPAGQEMTALWKNIKAALPVSAVKKELAHA